MRNAISWYENGGARWGFLDLTEKWSYKIWVDAVGQIWLTTNRHLVGHELKAGITCDSIEAAKQKAEDHNAAHGPKPYRCPSCGVSSRTAWEGCDRPDCPDGRDH